LYNIHVFESLKLYTGTEIYENKFLIHYNKVIRQKWALKHTKMNQ